MPNDPRLAAALQLGMKHSPAFRKNIEALDASRNVTVEFRVASAEWRDTLGADQEGHVGPFAAVTLAKPEGKIAIEVDPLLSGWGEVSLSSPATSDLTLVESLGHEVSHARDQQTVIDASVKASTATTALEAAKSKAERTKAQQQRAGAVGEWKAALDAVVPKGKPESRAYGAGREGRNEVLIHRGAENVLDK